MKNQVVAIDGPAASGKSTVSKKVAKELHWLYVDSGSFYRGATWKVLQEDISPTNTDGVLECMGRAHWDLFVDDDNAVRFSIDAAVPGGELRSEIVRESVSDIACIPEIRQLIGELLRSTADIGSLVMEGRDISSVVFPDASWKFYLDADPVERARRRQKDLVKAQEKTEMEKVLESLQRRDKKDSTRKAAPLQIALGAQVIDTTAMNIDEVVQFIVERVRKGSDL